MRHSQKGFTLLELLIAAAVGAILLGVVVLALNQSSQAARLHQDSQALTEDLRAALGLMADYVNWALAIYPPGYTLTLNSEQGQGYTVRNPRTGNGTWEVGRDPILALVLPPQDLSPNASCSSSQTAGCFRFAAFYLLSRQDVVRDANGASNPGPDPVNDPQARVLYLYQKVLTGWTPARGGSGSSGSFALDGVPPDTPFPGDSDIAGSRGFLLADYIRGEGNSPGLSVSYRRCLNGGTPGPCGGGTTLGFSASEVEITLRAFRAYRWPGRGVEVRLSQAAAPRNLGLLLR